MDVPTETSVAERLAERNELMRLCAQRIVDSHAAGRRIDPTSLPWARWTVNHIKPLGRPLSTGE